LFGGVPWVRETVSLSWHLHKPAGTSEHFREPGGSLFANVMSIKAILPHLDPHQILRLRGKRDQKIWHPLGRDFQGGSVNLDSDECHPRNLALGEKVPSLIHNHPTAIMLKSALVKASGG
jgi:hypothetical protein